MMKDMIHTQLASYLMIERYLCTYDVMWFEEMKLYLLLVSKYRSTIYYLFIYFVSLLINLVYHQKCELRNKYYQYFYIVVSWKRLPVKFIVVSTIVTSHHGDLQPKYIYDHLRQCWSKKKVVNHLVLVIAKSIDSSCGCLLYTSPSPRD